MTAKQSNAAASLPPLPEKPVDRLLEPVTRFLHVEAAGGIALLAATGAALLLANSPWAEGFLRFWKTPIGFQIGEFEAVHSLKHWINDGLMVIFFFVIGLEVKRELVLGELRELRRAALPIAAALGGMIAPAMIYLAFQWGGEAARGWGIPMATDIAFVVGCMALLGPRVPHSLRIVLLSLAIVDDIGAILVIAVGYTESLDFVALALGAAGIGAIVGLLRLGVRNVGLYTVLGILVWFAFHESGVHATIAGVILGLITPAESWVSRGLLGAIIHKAGHVFSGEAAESSPAHYGTLRHVEAASREAISPLERLENSLHPWVGFVIMPLFALANAGVPIQLSELTAPVSLAVMAGLVIGKPLGIVLFSWLAVRTGLAALPDRIGWGVMLAAGCLAGIGFTMALFIAGLALTGEVLDTAKIGILAGSVVSAALGIGLLLAILPNPARKD
jgi:NhaA family Na+:H+ antiporter